MDRDAGVRSSAAVISLDAPSGWPVLSRETVADSEGPRVEQPWFEDFVAARSRHLQRTAYLLTRDHHLAQDLVQTTYAKVCRGGRGSATIRRRTSAGR